MRSLVCEAIRGMRVLVCGGRTFDNALDLERALRPHQDRIMLLIHGGQTGADQLAGLWAQRRGIPVQEFKADWKTLGKAAGPIRNQKMLSEGKPDMVIAFPGSTGTADMVKKAKKAGVPVWEIPN
jgi:hypothetical protein